MSSNLFSILDSDYFVFPYIGPSLDTKTLLKPEIRDKLGVKRYIKNIYEKQKKKREVQIREHLSKYGRKFCEKKFIQGWMISMEGAYADGLYSGFNQMTCECCELVELLHSAVKRGLVDIVKYIIDIDPLLIHSQDGEYNNLITIAVVYQRLNVIKFIESHSLGKELKFETPTHLLCYYAKYYTGAYGSLEWYDNVKSKDY